MNHPLPVSCIRVIGLNGECEGPRINLEGDYRVLLSGLTTRGPDDLPNGFPSSLVEQPFQLLLFLITSASSATKFLNSFERHSITPYTMVADKSSIVWEKRWFVVDGEDGLSFVKKQFDSYYIPDQNSYVVKMGCVRDFAPADKCYPTEQEADSKIAELESLIGVREALAEYAHNAWSRWMRFMLGKGAKNEDGSIYMSPELIARWERQMNTPYQELTPEDRVSDRNEAHRIMDIVAKGAHPAPTT